MNYNAKLALNLVKDRLNRMRVATPDDEYLKTRVDAAAQQLARNGIHLTDTADDLMLLVDMTVWAYQNRDKMTGMPEWLRMARRERFLADRTINEGEDACC